MSGVVSRLEQFVRERIARNWPDLAGVRIEARPLLDLSLGDFGLDCCLEIGAVLKCPPEEVAQRFLAELPVHPDWTFVAVDGFLNATLRSPETLGADDRTAPGVGLEPHRIVVSPPTTQVSNDAFVRLASSAAIQAALVRARGGAAELCVGGTRCEGGSFSTLYRATLGAGLASSRDAARQAIESHLAHGAPQRVTVWMAPNFLERGEFREFYRRYFAGNPQLTVRCPARAWLDGFQESWVEIASRAECPQSAALMLASSRVPTELDEHALTLAEQGNLRWFLESTGRRIERLSNGAVALSPIPVRELSPTVRRVVIRAATIDWFERGAALRGEVTEWLDALTDLLRSLNLWLNAPQTRRELETGGIPLWEREILSGAGKAVSDIMQGNPLFYEVDRA